MLLAFAAGADVIYGDTNPSISMLAYHSDVYGQNDGTVYTAGTFTLSEGASVVSDIHWWGLYLGLTDFDNFADDDFTVSIFADNGSGAPADTALFSVQPGDVNRTATGDIWYGSGAPIYTYSIDIAPLALTPGVSYYLSIVNSTPNDNDWWSWVAAYSGSAWQSVDEGPWVLSGQNQAPLFYLTDDVVIPEPATLSLLGLGVFGLACRRLRRPERR
jgi:hypothetical protein